jgi:hypothetical protein
MAIVRSAAGAVEWLRENALPYSDSIELRASGGEFSRGGQYGVEIPAVNTLATLKTTIKLLKEEGVYCTRFNETHGSFLLSDQELAEMLALAAETGYGMVVGLGPRPEYDVKASFYRSEFGLEVGRRINNNDALTASVAEAMRLVALGCRGILVYDLGVLRVLSMMRRKRQIPAEVRFKTSSHCIVSNPMLAQIAAENGADSVTTLHDLGLPVLQEMRRISPNLCLDVPTDAYLSKGGFIRFYELAEMVQVAAPMFLKMGASVQGHPYDNNIEQLCVKRVRRVATGLSYMEKNLAQPKRIEPSDPLCCRPVLR